MRAVRATTSRGQWAQSRRRAAFDVAVGGAVERLEGRTLLSTFTVVNTSNSGAGSLRQAIIDANTNPGADTIDFNVGGGGQQTITPLTALPAMIGPTNLDATTQPGFAGAPLIELTGALAGGGANGLTVSGALSSGSSIRGLVINRFGQSGILVFNGSGSNTIAGNWIGLDATGAAAAGN